MISWSNVGITHQRRAHRCTWHRYTSACHYSTQQKSDNTNILLSLISLRLRHSFLGWNLLLLRFLLPDARHVGVHWLQPVQGLAIEAGPIGNCHHQGRHHSRQVDDEHCAVGGCEIPCDKCQECWSEKQVLHQLLRHFLTLPIHGHSPPNQAKPKLKKIIVSSPFSRFSSLSPLLTYSCSFVRNVCADRSNN